MADGTTWTVVTVATVEGVMRGPQRARMAASSVSNGSCTAGGMPAWVPR